jgi:hypothetical protein
MIEYNGKRTTPKLMAQQIILDSVSARADYWYEFQQDDYDKMTARERQLVDEQLDKQFERVQKMFGQEGWTLR